MQNGHIRDKRSLSLGELIRPFCITILYVNSPLFIDIFHVRALYLCYFIVFCEFYSFTELIIRVRFQLEKAPSEEVSSDRQKNWEKSENEVSSEITGGARRTARGEPGAAKGPPGAAPLGRSWWAFGGPRHPLRHPFAVLTPSDLIGLERHFV